MTTATKQTINVGSQSAILYDDLTDLDLPDLSSIEDRAELIEDFAAEWWGDGMYDVYRLSVGKNRWLYLFYDDGCLVSATIEDSGIEEFLRSCEWGDADVDEILAGFGLCDVQEASDDYTGPCRVWCQPNYYPGTYGAPQAGWVRDEDGHILEFASREDAEKYVDDYYTAPSGYDGIRACNVLSHGQAGADTLTIVATE